METTLEKFISLFPDKEKVMRDIWKERKKIETFDIELKDGINFTNDPMKMILCGASIESSYSPQSPSFKYLPTLVLQPYIGMIYIKDPEYTMVLNTPKGELIAPKYKCRAFVMCTGKKILKKFPTYTEDHTLYNAFDCIKDKPLAVIHSNTPPVQIHLDCMDMFEQESGHTAVCGRRITPFETIEMYYKNNKFRGWK